MKKGLLILALIAGLACGGMQAQIVPPEELTDPTAIAVFITIIQHQDEALALEVARKIQEAKGDDGPTPIPNGPPTPF